MGVRRTRTAVLAIAFAVVARWTGHTALGQAYTPFSFIARAISADGNVVAGTTDTNQVIRWTPDGGTQDLGVLSGMSGGQATAVSGNGQVIVGYCYGGSGSSFTAMAFHWTAAAGMQPLGTLPGYTKSWAYGVNADGSVVVGNCQSSYRAFRWTAGSMQDAGVWVPGAVSADGSIIVGVYTNRALRWTAATGTVDLGTLTGYSHAGLSASPMSADGSVIFGTCTDVGTAALGFRWTQAAGMTPLEGVWHVTGASRDGSLVFGDHVGDGGPIVWTTASGATAFAAFLLARGLDVSGAGDLRPALASSADNQVLLCQNALIDLRPRCGSADFNHDGHLSAQDIFDFLSAWFALDPRADFNGVGGLTPQDIFDFIGAWFVGCP